MSAKRTQKSYDSEFKAQAVKLAQEIGRYKAAKELSVPDGTIYCWIKYNTPHSMDTNSRVSKVSEPSFWTFTPLLASAIVRYHTIYFHTITEEI